MSPFGRTGGISNLFSPSRLLQNPGYGAQHGQLVSSPPFSLHVLSATSVCYACKVAKKMPRSVGAKSFGNQHRNLVFGGEARRAAAARLWTRLLLRERCVTGQRRFLSTHEPVCAPLVAFDLAKGPLPKVSAQLYIVLPSLAPDLARHRLSVFRHFDRPGL